MTEHDRAGVGVSRCTGCGGLFLRAADRGLLIEHETEWHLGSGPETQPIPRITPDMAAPTAMAQTQRARSFLDELFG